jgi:hypothetical protein
MQCWDLEMGSWNYLICEKCNTYQDVCKINYSDEANCHSLYFLEKHRRCCAQYPVRYVFEDEMDFKLMKEDNYDKWLKDGDHAGI